MKSDDPGEEFVTIGREETAQDILVLKTEGKKALGGPRCRWEYIYIYIQIDPKIEKARLFDLDYDALQ